MVELLISFAAVSRPEQTAQNKQVKQQKISLLKRIASLLNLLLPIHKQYKRTPELSICESGSSFFLV
ncbi:MAG TPA: hypothetical protein DCP36_08090 [Sporomusaceae bacterium]|nr:hypothetical protein [Sporomusaceae bacterium]